MLVSLAAAATGASVQRSIASAQSALATAGDALVTDFDDYLDCEGSTAAEIAAAYETTIDAVEVSGGASVDVASVAFWNGTVFGDSCQYAAGHRLQQIVLESTVRDEVSTLTVVKRPNDEPAVDLGPLPDAGGDVAEDGSANVQLTPGLDG